MLKTFWSQQSPSNCETSLQVAKIKYQTEINI